MATPIYFREKTLLFKKEVTEAQDSAPTGVANAIETVGLSITPMEGDLVAHEVDRANFGNYVQKLINKHVKIEFMVAIAGAGVAGSYPKYNEVLLCSGHAAVQNAGIDVQYKPVSGASDSASIYMQIGRNFHKLLGARGSLIDYTIAPNGFGYFKFEYLGLFQSVTDQALPVADISGFVQPVEVSNANTSFALHSFSPSLINFSFKQNNELKYRNVVGGESIQITDRKPSFSATIEAPLTTVKDYWAISEAGSLGDCTVIHGTAAGNTVLLNLPTTQILKPSYTDDDGIAAMTFEGTALPSANNSDYIILIK